ncbi:hypothetical protein [Pseudobutyrivibrio sp.]
MANMKLEAPWYTYQKKVAALFAEDNDIKVNGIYDLDNDIDGANYGFDIEVRKHDKFIALDRAMKKRIEFGNVKLKITLYDEENNGIDDTLNVFSLIFSGNPIMKDVKTIIDNVGVHHNYVRFAPKVVQFFNDDLSDYNGNWSGLAADICKEVFNQVDTYFCTASIDEG